MPLTENTKKLAKLVQTSKYTHDRMTLMGELDFRPNNDDRTYQRINIYEVFYRSRASLFVMAT